MNKDASLSIIIYSCWKNSGMWDIFSFFIKKFWKDCPYALCLITDKCEILKSSWAFDRILVCDNSWGEMMLYAMNEINSQYVMLFMDDYLLCDTVDNSRIIEALNFAVEHNAANVCLSPPTFCKTRMISEKVGIIPYRQPYSLSTQVGIWDVEFLKHHIAPNWSAWDFERIGSMKVTDKKQVYFMKGFYFPYIEAVRKGKWMENGKSLCDRSGVDISLTGKSVMSNWDMAKIYIKGAILDINPKLVLTMQNVFHFIKYKKR